MRSHFDFSQIHFDLFGISIALGAFALVFVLIGAVISIINYILKSLALYTLAKRRGLKYAGLAWVPVIAPEYVLGEIVGPFKLFGINLSSPGIILLVASAINTFGNGLFREGFAKFIVNILILLFILCFKYNLFKIYSPKNAVLYTVLSIIPLLSSIVLFIIKDYAPCGKAEDLFSSNQNNNNNYGAGNMNNTQNPTYPQDMQNNDNQN